MIGRYATIAGVIGFAAIVVGGLAPAPSEISQSAREAGPAAAGETGGGDGIVVLQRAGDSHFYTDVDIDGRSVSMVIDSGASLVTLSRRDAEAVGIDVDAVPVGGSALTAGGPVPVRPLVIERMQVGDIVRHDIRAAIIETEMPQSLLGQSFLAEIDSVAVAGDEMTLR